jgi:hypothetical protein
MATDLAYPDPEAPDAPPPRSPGLLSRALSLGLRAKRLQDEARARLIGGAADVAAGVVGELGRLAERLNRAVPLEPQERFVERREAGEGMQGAAEVIREALPMPAPDPARGTVERFVAEDLPQGAGALAGFLGSRLVGGPVGAVLAGVLGGAEAAGREAEQAGASPRDVNINELVGGAAGTLDALLPGRLGRGVAGRALAGALTESGTEAAQQLAGNLAKKLTYRPEQDLTEGLGRSAAVGAVLGGGVGAGTGLVLAREDAARPAVPELPTVPPRVAPAAPATVTPEIEAATLNRGLRQLRAPLRRLREQAALLEAARSDAERLAALEARLESVADEARGVALGAGREFAAAPSDPDFVTRAERAGVAVDDALRTAHRDFLREVAARDLVRLASRRAAATDEEARTRLDAAAKDLAAVDGAAARARVLLEREAALPAAEAAAEVLRRPDVAQWQSALLRLDAAKVEPLAQPPRELERRARAEERRLARQFVDLRDEARKQAARPPPVLLPEAAAPGFEARLVQVQDRLSRGSRSAKAAGTALGESVEVLRRIAGSPVLQDVLGGVRVPREAVDAEAARVGIAADALAGLTALARRVPVLRAELPTVFGVAMPPPSAPGPRGLALLAGAVPAPELRQMVFAAKDAVVLDEFVRADGTPQEPVRITPGSGYTSELLARVVAWARAADEAAFAPAPTNDPATIAGLEVGAGEAMSLASSRWTADQLAEATLGPGIAARLTAGSRLLRVRGQAARLLPGLFGQRVAQAAGDLERAELFTDGLYKREANSHTRATLAAMKSLGLEAGDARDAARFSAAKNEVANRLRQFGSGVAVGDSLLSASVRGRAVTPELLELLRIERGIFREAQGLVGKLSPVGGIRETRGRKRIVRPPRETGDVGLARSADMGRVRRLAEAVREAELAGTPREAALVEFFDGDPDALLSHVTDSGRRDLGRPREAALQPAMTRLAADLRAGRAQPPGSVAELTALLVARGVDPAAAPDALLRELDAYASAALARIVPEQVATPATGETTVAALDDESEFTSPAAPLMFPSSWYRYGSEAGGLRRALGRTIEPQRLAFALALRQGADHLRAVADAGDQAMRGGAALTSEAAAELRWALDDARADLGNPDTLSAAVTALRKRGDDLRDISREVQRDDPPRPTWLRETMSRIVGLWLSTSPAVALTNIVSGPVAVLDAVAPYVGVGRASRLALGLMARSPLAVGGHVLRGVVPAGWLDAARSRLGLGPSEVDALLEDLARGSSVPPLESLNLAGGASRGPLVRAARRAGQLRLARRLAGRPVGRALQRVSRAVGVEAGDAALNRALLGVALPDVVRGLKATAAAWSSRLVREGLAYSPADPRTALSADDAGGQREAAAVAELAGQLGLNEGDFLAAVLRLPWRADALLRDDLGRRIALQLLTSANVATSGNRPQPSLLLQLKGWTGQRLANLADLVGRGTPGEDALASLRRAALPAAAAPLLLAAGWFASRAAVTGADAAWNRGLDWLASLLGDGPDDDDEAGVLAWLDDVAEALAAVLRASPPRELLPVQAGFWQRPGREIIGDIANSIGGGVGVPVADILEGRGAERVPVFSVGTSLAKSIGLGLRAAMNVAEGRPETARADARRATVTGLSVGGLPGRMAGRIVATPGASGSAEAAIRDAARRLGLRVDEPTGRGTGFLPAASLRRELLVAGHLLADERTRAEGVKRLQRIQGEVYAKARDAALASGSSPTAARRAGSAAVVRVIASTEPMQYSLGRTVTRDELARLDAALAGLQAVAAQRAAATAAAEALRATPAPGLPRPRVTTATLSPLRTQEQVEGRANALAGARRRRALGVRRRSPRPGYRTRRPARVRLRRGYAA